MFLTAQTAREAVPAPYRDSLRAACQRNPVAEWKKKGLFETSHHVRVKCESRRRQLAPHLEAGSKDVRDKRLDDGFWRGKRAPDELGRLEEKRAEKEGVSTPKWHGTRRL